MIQKADLPELIGEIIDIFEDFLEEHHVQIHNEEKLDPNVDEDACAIIYGSHYDNLQTSIESLLKAWGLVESEKKHLTEIRVKNLYNPDLEVCYKNVESINNVTDKDGKRARQICLDDGSTVTYPVENWIFFTEKWVMI